MDTDEEKTMRKINEEPNAIILQVRVGAPRLTIQHPRYVEVADEIRHKLSWDTCSSAVAPR